MARSNGPFGPPGAPLRRRPGEAPFGAPSAQPSGQWPPHPQGYGDNAPPPPSMQGYHFPPPEPVPNYGYGNQQLLAQQQWGQQDPQAYNVGYQAYAPNDPGPFPQAVQHHQHQGYADAEPDYGEEFYEDEEPRRGRRWLLIAVALVGAIGVGGALAYTYRSLIAPHSGRVPLVKADPNVKVKPDQRGGKELAGAEKKLPVRASEEPKTAPEPETTDESPTESLGPKSVKTIPIAPGGAPPPSAPPPSIPGITLYQPPQTQQPTAPSPPVQAPPSVQAPPKASGRVVVGRPPPSTEPEEDDPPSVSAPPVKRPPSVQSPPVGVKPAPVAPKAPAPKASGGVGYVAVLSSQKTYLKALEVFADLQQQYGSVLGNKTPDVQEADLSARGLGTMYRLVVGPPGSHHAASGVCVQLRTAGYEGCWVKEY